MEGKEGRMGWLGRGSERRKERREEKADRGGERMGEGRLTDSSN